MNIEFGHIIYLPMTPKYKQDTPEFVWRSYHLILVYIPYSIEYKGPKINISAKLFILRCCSNTLKTCQINTTIHNTLIHVYLHTPINLLLIDSQTPIYRIYIMCQGLTGECVNICVLASCGICIVSTKLETLSCSQSMIQQIYKKLCKWTCQ